MRAIQLGAAFYIALLLLLCVFGRKDLAAIIQMGATVAGLCACGSGAAKVGSYYYCCHAHSRGIVRQKLPTPKIRLSNYFVLFLLVRLRGALEQQVEFDMVAKASTVDKHKRTDNQCPVA